MQQEKLFFYNALEGAITTDKQKETFDRNCEVEADLLATTVAEYGRGLRDSFVNLIEKCGHKGFPPCAAHYTQPPGYPSTIQRINYITESLCAQYPDKNHDICNDSIKQYLHNATCPVY